MSPVEVTVIDYGVGNLLSVRRGLEQCGAKVTLSDDPAQILSAARVVLPGVGAFANGMQALEARGLVPVLRELARRGVPLLGICLGMQLLLDESEEFGRTAGLGLIAGRVVRVPARTRDGQVQKVPHIGWNGLLPAQAEGWAGSLLADNEIGEAAYFVHSFVAEPADPAHRLADCDFGGWRLAAAIRSGRITGCQFHPEKSGDVGLKVLRRFCED